MIGKIHYHVWSLLLFLIGMLQTFQKVTLLRLKVLLLSPHFLLLQTVNAISGSRHKPLAYSPST